MPRSAASSPTPKGRPLRDLPRDRRRSPDARQPDAPQAPAGGAGDRAGVRGRLGRGGRDEPAGCSSWGRTPRPRTGWRRRCGSRASSAPRASTTRRRSRSTRPTGSPSATSTGSGCCSSRRARRPSPAQEGSKAPVSIFVEETGKTGFAHLIDLPDRAELAQVNPGDRSSSTPEGNRLIAISNGMRIGVVEPRVAARLLKLIADGNKYLAGVTSLGEQDVRIIIREIYQDPRNYGKVSFPTAAKSTDLRPYTKGTLVREDEELEEDLEDDDRGRGDRGPRPRHPARGHDGRGVRRGDRRARGAVDRLGRPARRRDRRRLRRRGAPRVCDNPRWLAALLLRAEPASACRPSSASRRRRRPRWSPRGIERRARARRHRRSTCSAAAAGSRGPRSIGQRKGDQPRGHRRSTGCSPRSSCGRPTSATSTPRSRRWPRPPAGESSLKVSITDRFATPLRDLRAAGHAGRDHLVDRGRGRGRQAERPAADRKHYRCPVCRDQLGGGEQRQAPLDARRPAARPRPGRRRRRGRPLRDRFPVPRGRRVAGRRAARPPHAAAARRRSRRSSSGSRATSARRRSRRRCGSRCSTRSLPGEPPGDVTGPRRPAADRRRPRPAARPAPSGASATRGSRSRTACGWSGASSSGSRAALGPGPGAARRRPAEPRRGVGDGDRSSRARPAALGALAAGDRATRGAARRPRDPARPRHAAAPARPGAARAGRTTRTAWVLGREAAALLPLEPLFGPAVRPSWGWQAAAITRALAASSRSGARRAGRVPARGRRPGDARRGGARRRRRGLPARRGAAARGRTRGSAASSSWFRPGSARRPGGPRTRANVALDAGARRRRRPGHRARGAGLFAPPERLVDAGRSRREDAARAVIEPPSTSLKLRGEPVELEPGCSARSSSGSIARATSGASSAAGRRPSSRPPDASRCRPPAPRRPGTGSRGAAIMRAPRRALIRDAPRFGGPTAAASSRIGDGPLVARRRTDRDAAAVPLADRVEWAVYSLLSTAGPMSEAAFLERIAESVHRPRPARRGARPRLPRELPQPGQHARPAGHRRGPPAAQPGARASGSRTSSTAATGSGYACWIGRRQQSRRLGRRPLGECLDDRERARLPAHDRPVPGEELGDVDCIWYVRGRAAFLFEVEWTAMLGEPVLRRHARMPTDDASSGSSSCSPNAPSWSATSSTARRCCARRSRPANWHLVKANHLRDWASREEPTIAGPRAAASGSTPRSSGPASSWRCSAEGDTSRGRRTRATLGRRPSPRLP